MIVDRAQLVPRDMLGKAESSNLTNKKSFRSVYQQVYMRFLGVIQKRCVRLPNKGVSSEYFSHEIPTYHEVSTRNELAGVW